MTDYEMDDLADALAWQRKVSGVDDKYLSQWPQEAWLEWMRAMYADRSGPNPCVPDWMQPIIAGQWGHDFSLPYPQVAQLWPTGHNWFGEADTHPELTLRNIEYVRPLPSLEQIRRAWEFANSDASAIPLVSMCLTPTQPWGARHVIGEIEALYVVTDPSNRAVLDECARLMGSPGSTTINGFADTDDLKRVGIEVVPGHAAHAWEWF